MYGIGEACEGIKILGRIDEKSGMGGDVRDTRDIHINDALTRLEGSVASAHTALDDFYAAR